MRSFSIALFLISVMTACKPGEPYRPDQCFTADQQAALIRECVRYSAKLAPQATNETKFARDYDDYYAIAAQEYDWRECAPAGEGEYYFLMTRKARSIWPAREAIGGKLKIDKATKLTDYEEVFRTWKMTEDSLNARAFELFDLMVKGKDLTTFGSKYKGDRYIEFPDERYYFNKKERRWRDHVMDSVQQEF